MNWHYESDGQPKGPVTEFELRRLFATGTITTETLIWSKGMRDWEPFHKAIPPPPLPETAPLTPDIEPEKDTPPQPSDIGASIDEESVMPSWETQTSAQLISAFFRTISESLTNPSFTFSKLPKASGWGRPLSFYILCGVISFVLWTMTFHLAPPPEIKIPALNLTLLFGVPLSLLLFPIQAVATTALLHFSLWITGGSNKSFENTFRVVTYAIGSTSLLLVIPLAAAGITASLNDPSLSQSAVDLGSFVMAIWSVIIVVKAIASAHEISLGRAILALLLPLVLFVGLGLCLAVAFGAAAGI